jgi:uncharacterized membrane protein YgcG
VKVTERRCRLGRLLLVGLGLLAASLIVVMSPPSSSRASALGAVSSSAPVSCPEGVSSCVSVTIPPSCTSLCPTIVAGPTTDLGEGQYVYLSMSNFPRGDTVRIAYCPTDAADTVVSNPECAFGSSSYALNPFTVPVTSNGTAEASAQTQYDPPGPDVAPIPSSPIVNGPPPSSFFCDNGAQLCALEVTDDGPPLVPPSNPTDTTSNTAIIPLNFNTGLSGCPTSDPVLFTDSSYSVEHLLPAAVDSSCVGSKGTIAVNTAFDSQTATTDVASGGAPVDFTDDPSDPQLQQILRKGSAGPFAYIPVAVSATVMAFHAASYEPVQGVSFPISSFALTPNMVAGILTTTYFGATPLDSLIPPLVCKQLVGCNSETEGNFNTFNLLDPVANGLEAPVDLGAFFSSTASGASYQLTNWMCSAPNSTFDVTVREVGSRAPQQIPVRDRHVPAKTLTTPPEFSPFWNGTASQWPYPQCVPYSTLGTLNPGTVAGYTPAVTPALQAKAMRGYPVGGQSLHAAFGAMDASEAVYNGLNIAALMNAAGNFVLPSTSSVDAALNDATANADGTLSFNYDNTGDAGAYPMPMVTYAVVPTSPLPATQAKSLRNLLTNIVAYTHAGGGSVPFPGGYFPLPDNLYNQATAAIANDIHAAPSSSHGGGGNGPGSGSGGSGAFGGGSGIPGRTLGIGATFESGGFSSPSGPSASSSGHHSDRGGNGGPIGHRLFQFLSVPLLIGDGRFILPVLLGIAGALVVIGPLCFFFPNVRRRIVAVVTGK